MKSEQPSERFRVAATDGRIEVLLLATPEREPEYGDQLRRARGAVEFKGNGVGTAACLTGVGAVGRA